MLVKFIESLIVGLIGFGLVYPFVVRVQSGRWKPITAIVIEVAAFAFGFASREIVYGFYPQLHEGWTQLAISIVVIWLVFLPGVYLGSRIRKNLAV